MRATLTMERANARRQEREREALQALLALLLHLLLLLLLPGLVIRTPPLKELLVEIRAPREASAVGGARGLANSPISGSMAGADPSANESGHVRSAALDSAGATQSAETRTESRAQPRQGSAHQPAAEKHGAAPSQTAAARPQPLNKPSGGDATDAVVPPPVIAKPDARPAVPQTNPAAKPVPGQAAPAAPTPAPEAKPAPAPKQPKKETDEGVGGSQPGSAGEGGTVEEGKSGGTSGGGVNGKPGGGSPGGHGTGDVGPGPAAGPPGPSEAELRLLEEYGDRCREKIRQLARTPEVATEKGHKGKVKFAFTVSAKGKLLGVEVLDSAGYGELDNECLEATRVAAQYFGRFPKGVPVDKWTFTMTLKFPLY